MKYLVALLALMVITIGGADALWKGTSATLERTLQQTHEGPSDRAMSSGEVPPPVARFLAHTLPANTKPIRTAHLSQEGEFFLNGAWKPLRATQMFTASPPAFVWDARIELMPLVQVYVRDAYILGRASMRARVAGLYPVVNQADTPELNAGALMRFLGEATWLPTRLMPGDGLTWEGVDADRAKATLTDGTTTVSLTFRFSGDGDIVELYSPDRFREVNGTFVPTPWRVRAEGYANVAGIRVMSPAVAEWILPEGPQPYWRARITSVSYSY